MSSVSQLTKCRQELFTALTARSPVRVKLPTETNPHPARFYAEFRLTGPKTRPSIDSRFKLYVLVIGLPAPDTNAYHYVDIANQFHDILTDLAVTVSGIGCLRQDGAVIVEDFGYVDKTETIQQATVICELLLEM